MLDTPRACMRSESLCRDISFHSYDLTNLTQLTYGLSQKDSLKYMPLYLRTKALQVWACVHAQYFASFLPYNQLLLSCLGDSPTLSCTLMRGAWGA